MGVLTYCCATESSSTKKQICYTDYVGKSLHLSSVISAHNERQFCKSRKLVGNGHERLYLLTVGR